MKIASHSPRRCVRSPRKLYLIIIILVFLFLATLASGMQPLDKGLIIATSVQSPTENPSVSEQTVNWTSPLPYQLNNSDYGAKGEYTLYFETEASIQAMR